MTAPQTRPLRVIGLNSMPWAARKAAWRPGEAANPLRLEQGLARHGIAYTALDPGDWLERLFRIRHVLLQGADPWRALRVLAGQRGVDAVLCYNEGPPWAPLLWRGLARFRPPILVYDLILAEDWRLRNMMLDAVVPRADRLLLVSEFQRAYVARRWGREAGVEVVGHDIDAEFWTAQPFAPEGPVLSIGEDHSRDFRLLLDAVEGLDVPLLLKTRRVPAGALLPPGVTLRSERLSDPDLRDLYAASRFVVVPLTESLNAGGINAILEAAACGRAAVISDNPAIRDFLRHEETCLVVPCGDRDAMRAAIARLMAEPETCLRLGAGARRMAEAIAGEGGFVARIAAALRQAAEARAR